jgi:hypothetical protein
MSKTNVSNENLKAAMLSRRSDLGPQFPCFGALTITEIYASGRLFSVQIRGARPLQRDVTDNNHRAALWFSTKRESNKPPAKRLKQGRRQGTCSQS